MRRQLLWICAFLCGSAGTAYAGNIQVHPSWTNIGAAAPDDIVSMLVMVSLNESFLDAAVANVSDPCSPTYGEYWDAEKTMQLLKGHPKSEKKVRRWVQNASSTLPDDLKKRHVQPTGPLYRLSLSVSQAQELLQARFSKFALNGKEFIYPEAFETPLELKEHADISFERPVHALSAQKIQKRQLDNHINEHNDIMQVCGDHVTPQCIQSLYGLNTYKPKVPQSGHIGVIGFLHQIPSPLDLRDFLNKNRPDAVDAKLPIYDVSEQSFKENLSLHGSEASLDIQTLVALSWPISVTFYYQSGKAKSSLPTPVEDSNTNEPFLSVFHYLLSLPEDKLPQVISISYADVEGSVQESYARRVCYYAALLGLRGVTVLTSSADRGVGPEEEKCGSHNKTAFVPWFPASCPYVTVVGGSQNPAGESVAATGNDFVSGSGFSNYFARPAWQETVVQDYLDKVIQKNYTGMFNPQGRAYPDVSALSTRFLIQANRHPVIESGTSAATPVFAAVVSLLNDARMSANQSRLGFMNPMLYKHVGIVPNTFNDIKAGTSSGCGTPGFAASPGWDMASGFGTPNFENLHNAILDKPQCV